MNTEHTSIWRKSWNYPRWRIFLGWLFTSLVWFVEAVVFSNVLDRTRQHMPGVFMFSTLFFTGLAALVLLFALIIPTRLRQRLFNRRMMGRYAFGAAGFITVAALFYAEEDWRGKYLWRKYVREQEAQGEKMNFIDFRPPSVPDDQNLALCPLLKPVLDYEYAPAPRTMINGRMAWQDREVIWHDTNGLSRVQRLSPWYYDGWSTSARTKARKELDAHPLTNGWINLAAWQNLFRAGTNLAGIAPTNSPAADVLLALRPLAADLAELQHEAERRPLARWPVHYDTQPPSMILLQHLSCCRNIIRLLQLRSAARLATGDTDGAVLDLRLGFRLADSLRTEPFLISQLVGIVDYENLCQALREGLARHQFSDGQLVELQAMLESVDLLPGWALSMRCERALKGEWSNLSELDMHALLASTGGNHADNRTLIEISFLFLFAPSGWVYQNQLSSARLEERYLFPVIDAPARLAHPGQANAYVTACKTNQGPFQLMSKVWLREFLPPGPCRVAADQTELDQARVACALERYRLARGEYPPTLDALAPQFIQKLPRDLIGGQPLHYRRADDGRFLLYSIGWNEKDDGGQEVLNKDGKPNLEQGDWVWRYPARQGL